jgi:hypothetical protein
MSYGIGQTEANAIINGRFQAGSPTGPATIYLALFTAAPTDSTLGTEATYGTYARLAITCNSTNFPNASAGSTTLATAQTFSTSTGTSNTITDTAFNSASSGGTQNLYWGDLSASQAIATGNTPQFNANAITISFS